MDEVNVEIVEEGDGGSQVIEAAYKAGYEAALAITDNAFNQLDNAPVSDDFRGAFMMGFLNYFELISRTMREDFIPTGTVQ